MRRSYKFRIYPNSKQVELINKTLGCCRFIYNHFLAKRKKLHETEGRNLHRFECSAELPKLKETHTWLKEVSAASLQLAIKILDEAYQNFFKKNTNYPKFKNKKNSIQSYQNNVQKIKIKNNFIQLPKLGKIKFDNHREINGRILNVIISKSPTNKYYISIVHEFTTQPLKESNRLVGIDLGIKHFAVFSTGEKIENPKFFNRYQEKLANAQRKLSRRKKGGKNREKARTKVAKIHEKIKNCRNDFLHKLSTRLIRENQVIVLEDLNVAGMVKNRKLSKNIADCSWGIFKQYLKYKADWYGRKVHFINRFTPTTSMCNRCKQINLNIKGFQNLIVREWQCPSCEIWHDRDINAAKNIVNTFLSAGHAEIPLGQFLDYLIQTII